MQRVNNVFVLVLLLSLMGIGCGVPDREAAENDFSNAMEDLKGALPEGKVDVISQQRLCKVLKHVSSMGDKIHGMTYFNGRMAQATVGGINGMVGRDNVWDLTHHQHTVSRYYGGGLSTTLAAVNGSVYAGLAYGVEKHVTEWNGYFVLMGTSLSLPFLKDFLSLQLVCFIGAKDLDKNGIISPNEMALPPPKVSGCAGGLQVGASPIPTPLPVSVSMQEGLWKNQREATISAAERDRDLGANLQADDQGNLYVAYGNEGHSHTKRGYWVARSMLRRTTDPLTLQLSVLSVALGVLQDQGTTYHDLCM